MMSASATQGGHNQKSGDKDVSAAKMKWRQRWDKLFWFKESIEI